MLLICDKFDCSLSVRLPAFPAAAAFAENGAADDERRAYDLQRRHGFFQDQNGQNHRKQRLQIAADGHGLRRQSAMEEK